MPFEPLRFLHAANVFLDCPPDLPADSPGSLRDVAETATLNAFRHVVRACRKHEVDFLLLTGNTFVETDRSLQARIALNRGLRELDEAGIRVFVLPGENDPADAWQSIPDLPECVTVFGEDDREPVAVFRTGKVIAAIGRVCDLEPPATGEDENAMRSRGPFRVGLCTVNEHGEPQRHEMFPMRSGRESGRLVSPCSVAFSRHLESSRVDYLALGGAAVRTLLRTNAGLIHHPGSPQPLSAADNASGSCTLVEVGSRDDVDCTSIPTAAVRYESVKLPVHPEWTADELKAAMREHVTRQATRLREQVRMIDWRLSVPSHGGTDISATELCESLPAQLNPDSPVHLLHTVTCCPLVATEEPCTPAADALAKDFVRSVRGVDQSFAAALDARIDDGADAAAMTSRLNSLIGRLDAAAVIARAREIGLARLQQDVGEGLHG